MNIYNLTRYNIRRDYQDHYNDCRMTDIDPEGEFLKFECVKAEFIKYQQLKKEIAGIANIIDFRAEIGLTYEQCQVIVKKLRELASC